MFSLNSSILLRRFYTSCLMHNAMRSIKGRNYEFCAIVHSNNLNFVVMLGEYEVYEIDHIFLGLTFIFHKCKPSEFAAIINSSQKICMSMNRRDCNWSPNIKVYKIERL